MNINLSHWLRLVAVVALGFAMAACSSASVQDERRALSTEIPPPTLPDVLEATPAGDPERGAQLFTQSVGDMPSCSTCHALDDTRIVGPGMAGVAARAERRVEGVSAVEYLHNSIVEPGAYVVEGFPNVMPEVFEQTLSDAEIRDLIAYLLSL